MRSMLWDRHLWFLWSCQNLVRSWLLKTSAKLDSFHKACGSLQGQCRIRDPICMLRKVPVWLSFLWHLLGLVWRCNALWFCLGWIRLHRWLGALGGILVWKLSDWRVWQIGFPSSWKFCWKCRWCQADGLFLRIDRWAFELLGCGQLVGAIVGRCYLMTTLNFVLKDMIKLNQKRNRYTILFVILIWLDITNKI